MRADVNTMKNTTLKIWLSDPPSWTPGMARPAPMTVHVRQEVSPMLQTGDLVPHFTVTTFSGESFD